MPMIRYRTITTVAAILTCINAFFFLFLPDLSFSLLGSQVSSAGSMVMRMSGACAFGLAIITWSLRKTPYPEVKSRVVLANILTFGILIAVEFSSLLQGVMNIFGWFIFAADVALCLGFILSLFTNRG